MTIYRCKDCRRTFRREQELQGHLHWHHITDKDVHGYFTEEEEEEETLTPAKPLAASSGDANPRKRGRFYTVIAVAAAAVLLVVAYPTLHTP